MKFSKIVLASLLLCFAAILTACGGSSSTAKEVKNDGEFVPSKQVDMIVGYAAGGGGDLTARTATKVLAEEGIVDETMVVTNMPGASGSLALMELKKRKGDEHVLIQVPNIAEPLWQEGKINAEFSDYTPIAQVATEPMIITVEKNSPYQTIEEFLEALKKDPSKIVISTSSAIDGGEPFRWNSIKEAYGIEKELNIMTTGGQAESFQNLLGGHSDAGMLTQALLKGNVENGSLRPLAVLGDERLELYPDIPTLKEVGYDVTYYRTRGFWAAGDISPAAVKYWENTFKELTESEGWKKFSEDQGMLNQFKDSEDYKAAILEEAPQYQDYLKKIK
ncbi:tripartite tricarboxylate transporter substrate binding protein [Niallia sp. Krafla_26]|uniref:tripartite tricarboxylate transporter substrate binding protein n=1 Tax=Niallia sp. Krafla_26 TaxID=3064703 RepID=UPI003D185A52